MSTYASHISQRPLPGSPLRWIGDHSTSKEAANACMSEARRLTAQHMPENVDWNLDTQPGKLQYTTTYGGYTLTVEQDPDTTF